VGIYHIHFIVKDGHVVGSDEFTIILRYPRHFGQHNHVSVNAFDGRGDGFDGFLIPRSTKVVTPNRTLFL
jgi:hypothetical protein